MEKQATKRGSVGEAWIPAEEVAALFRCVKCHVTPLKPPVYACHSGHPTCSVCFNHHNRSCFSCAKCKEVLLGRNLNLEYTLKQLPTASLNALADYSRPIKHCRSEQSLDLTYLRKIEAANIANIELKQAANINSSEEVDIDEKDEVKPVGLDAGDCAARSCSSTISTFQRISCRPVLCPYPCGRLVTVSGIFPHFELHHSDVHVGTVRRDQVIYIDVRQRDIDRESRCLAVLIVQLDETEDDSGEPIKLVRPAPAQLLKITRSNQELLKHGLFISTISVGRLKMPNPLTGTESWWLTAWGTSLYHSSLPYSLEVFSEASPHSISYSGPLVSLHRSQKPQDVFSSGGCLMVPPVLIKEMQFSSQIPLKLRITYHSQLPRNSSFSTSSSSS